MVWLQARRAALAARHWCLASAPTDATRPFSPGVWLRMQLLEQSGKISRAHYSQVLSTHTHTHTHTHTQTQAAPCMCTRAQRLLRMQVHERRGAGFTGASPKKKKKKNEVKDWAGSSQCVRIHLHNIYYVLQNIFKILKRQRRYGNKQICSRRRPRAEWGFRTVWQVHCQILCTLIVFACVSRACNFCLPPPT